MIAWAEDFKSSAWAKYFKPALDYVVRLAELVVLAAIFRLAADQTGSFFLEAMALVLIFVIGAYSSIPLGLIYHRFHGVKVKNLKLAIVIALFTGVAMSAGSYFAGVEVSKAIRALSAASQ